MPKKKIAKQAKMKKPTAKLQKQTGVLILAEKVEKEFRQLPAKLAKLYRQELMIQKKQESRLKVDVKKAKALQKAAQKKQAVLAKARMTQSTGKQLIKAKKADSNAEKMLKMLTLKLNQMSKKGEMLRAKQTRFTLLGKELTRLEKKLVADAFLASQSKKPVVKPVKSSVNKRAQSQVAPKNTIDEDIEVVSSETEVVEM